MLRMGHGRWDELDSFLGSWFGLEMGERGEENGRNSAALAEGERRCHAKEEEEESEDEGEATHLSDNH